MKMAFSLTEYITEKYYKSDSWIVERDIPILKDKGKQHWSDLDILAFKENVHLISCKDFLPDNKKETQNKIIENLNIAERFIRNKYKFLDSNDIDFEKKYVYIGTAKKTIDTLENNNIECMHLNEILFKYIKNLDNFLIAKNKERKDIPKGKRYYVIGNLEGLDKFIVYLLNNNLLNEAYINEELKKLIVEELSKIKQ